MSAQTAEQLGIFGKLLGENLASTVERGFHIGHAGIVALLGRERLFQILRRFDGGRKCGIGQQCLGQRLEARLARNLRLRAALLLVRQVQIFQPLLAVRRFDARPQFRRQLVLLLDAFQNGRATLLHLAQIDQSLAQRTQLGIVQPTGRLLAIAGDEWHGRTLIDQRDSRNDLRRL